MCTPAVNGLKEKNMVKTNRNVISEEAAVWQSGLFEEF